MRHFGYLIYRASSLILLFVVVFMPLSPVFAEEPVPETIPPEPALEPAPSSEPEPAESLSEPEVQAVVTEVPPETAPSEAKEGTDPGEDTDAAPEDILEVPEASAPTAEAIPDDTEATSSRPAPQTDDLLPPTDLESATTTPDVPMVDASATSSGDGGEMSSSSPETNSEDISTTTDTATVATTTIAETETDSPSDLPLETEETLPEENEGTTTEETAASEPVNIVTNDENRFTFSKSECTAVGNGTYYCATEEEEPEVTYTDRIFAATDADGDKEIFMERDGELTALTHNTVDDDAPYFDDTSNTIVWHRLIDGRYQILSYDLDSEEEEQITSERHNSMQPSRYGSDTVWQGWVGNDWEIFLLSGDEERMLTDNTTHDIMPSIHGTHVVWQSFENDAWTMKVYDIESGVTDTVSASEGGSIQNPRFVLVYDTKFETGDVETKGYDLGSGEVIDLGSKPAPVPEDIPDPDGTGEKRALVSQTSQPKPKTEDEPDIQGGGGEPPVPSDPSPAIPDVVISSPATSTATSTSVSAPEDIVIPQAPEPATTTEHIEDLIVPPFEEVTAETVPDNTVATST